MVWTAVFALLASIFVSTDVLAQPAKNLVNSSAVSKAVIQPETGIDDFAITALCVVKLIPCKGGPNTNLPTADKSVVSAHMQLSDPPACYNYSRIYVKNESVKPVTAYIVDQSAPIGYDFMELAPGFSASKVVTQRPDPYVIAVADDAKPSDILYAFSVQTDPVCTLQTYTPPVRPYDPPVVRYKVLGCSDTRIELSLGKPLPQGVVGVQIVQNGFSPDDQSFQSVSLNAQHQWQRLSLVMPIKIVPAYILAYDNYGTILEWQIIAPPKGCKITYDPSVIVPPMGK